MTPFLRGARALLATAAFVLAGTAAPAQTAWVSSEKDHALTLLDLKTQAVTGTVPTCQRPRHLRLTPDRKLLLVACGDDGRADVIDVATRQSVRRIGLGEDPEIFDLTPDGKTLYVSNEEDGVVGVIDVATGQRKGQIAVGKEPEGVRVSPDGARVYVTSEAANLVSIIDTVKFAVVATLRFEIKGARAADITPVGLLMTRDGRRAFVALGRANHVAFVDVATRKVTDLVLVGRRAWGLGLDAAEKTLLVVNGLSDDLTIVDVAAARPLKTVKVGRVPHSVVVVE